MKTWKRPGKKTYQVSKYSYHHDYINISQLWWVSLLVKVQITCFSSSSMEPSYCKIELAWQSLPIGTISFLSYSQVKALTSKDISLLLFSQRQRQGGWEWRCLPPYHTSSPQEVFVGKPGSRSSLEGSMTCPLKYPSSYLRSCRPDNISRLFLGPTLVSELTIELAEPWDLRELNPCERPWHQSYPQSQGIASNWSPDLEDKR